MNKYMEIAKENADNGIKNKEGGPFGAVIVDKDGKIIANGNNQVLKQNDPTAHAEMVAIRNACKKLEKYDLSGYILYTSCEPCPMCLGAILWSNMSQVYYGCTRQDSAEIGFRDDAFYRQLNGKEETVSVQEFDRETCLELFNDYAAEDTQRY